MKLDIAERTRTLEMIGFSLSLFALLISLTIFCNFRWVKCWWHQVPFDGCREIKRFGFPMDGRPVYRSLRNTRTKIHKNLFVAMIIQVIIRLTLYMDQAIVRNRYKMTNESHPGIENTVSRFRLFLCVKWSVVLYLCTVFSVVALYSNYELSLHRRFPCSHTSAKAPMCYWNTHERLCLCGCSLRDCICTTLLPWRYSKADFRIMCTHFWDGVFLCWWPPFGRFLLQIINKDKCKLQLVVRTMRHVSINRSSVSISDVGGDTISHQFIIY